MLSKDNFLKVNYIHLCAKTGDVAERLIKNILAVVDDIPKDKEIVVSFDYIEYNNLLKVSITHGGYKYIVKDSLDLVNNIECIGGNKDAYKDFVELIKCLNKQDIYSTDIEIHSLNGKVTGIIMHKGNLVCHDCNQC